MFFRKSEIIKALRQANDDICNFNDKLEKENFVLKKNNFGRTFGIRFMYFMQK